MTELASDTISFLDALPTRTWQGTPLLDPARPTVVARVPGRLDVMGGIADYSGALVLQQPLAVAIHAAVQRTEEDELVLVSYGRDEEADRRFSIPLSTWLQAPEGVVAATRARCRGEERWAGYVLGPLAMVGQERGLGIDGGLRIAIASDVPEGRGVASSAALEVATLGAIAALLDLELDETDLARLCQRAEHEVCDAPCGIMDQMAVILGREGQLLSLRCQPAEVQGHLSLPEGVCVWGLDSGVDHDVSGEAYREARTAAFMGYRVLADAYGLEAHEVAPGRVAVDDMHWHGYLANVLPAELENELYSFLPALVGGRDFLRRYGGITDDVTTIDPEVRYRVRAATCHAIRESTRIRQFADRLAQGPDEPELRMMGAWMALSHAGYGDCGIGSPVCDRILDLVRAAGPMNGLYGARITGGGSGGTVAILGRFDAAAKVEEIAATLGKETGHTHGVLTGSSPGLTVHRIAP